MTYKHTSWRMASTIALFVLLWGSAPLFTRWGLDNGSPLAFLVLRFSLALCVLSALRLRRGRWLPAPGTRLQVVLAGALLIGLYSLCYLLAMDHGVTPGVMSTLLGVQPVLTLLLTERRYSPSRLAGLLLALAGLALVVWQSVVLARFSVTGILLALCALACITSGSLLQKRIQQAPTDVLPLQYVVSLVLSLVCAPFMPFEASWQPGFVIPLLWLGLGISVAAQLLLYRMIRGGNLVNVTSLFYLVPLVTVLLDFLVFGNALSTYGLIGMAGILCGLWMVLGRKGII
ncbi:DMT family transporter [Allopusillimonas soli]|uniref:DMT family transporter n=1 Tax=Allopusillimonas soli TaxID=659016 RepID=A0A853FCV6_9BURK|nr:DMT family transporter [Allopusillimonas soli]NYT37777.1 DMT family transporter [Allopusillimonas soli]TEA73691.1 DMT family transporter [Allopusillimonas soli]